MRVAIIFDRHREGTTGMYVEAALRGLGVACDHWWLRDVRQLPAGYDLYLRVDHGDDYETALPSSCRPAAFYAIDTHLPHSWRKIQRVAARYDMVFCCHRDAVERLAAAEWLPVACDPSVHAGPTADRVWDVAFVGTEGGLPRKFYLQTLRERYPNSFIGTADYRQMASLYGRSRIGFNYSIRSDVNMRMFEIMAAGALLVTDAGVSADLGRLGFRDREHLAMYRSPGELFRLVDHYLAHPRERQGIAQAGQRLALERHTYRHRMQSLLATVSQRLGMVAA